MEASRFTFPFEKLKPNEKKKKRKQIVDILCVSLSQFEFILFINAYVRLFRINNILD